jgi:hypothetical protein
MLAQALVEERKVYVSLAGSFAMREAAAREVIISSGAAPRSAALRPLAQSLELDLAPNAEALLGQSLPLRQGAIAHDQALLEARNRQIEESYASAQRALERLARAHSEFDGTGEPRLAEVQRALDELNALLAALKAQKP